MEREAAEREAVEREAVEREAVRSAAVAKLAAEREAAEREDAEAKQAGEGEAAERADEEAEQAGQSRRRALVAVGVAVAVAALGGGVWLATGDDDGASDPGSGGERLDCAEHHDNRARRASRTHRWHTGDVDPFPDGIAGDQTGLWVASTFGDSLAVINPANGTVTPPMPVGSEPLAVAQGFGSIWVTMRNDDKTWRIDPATGDHQEIDTPDTPAALGMGGDAVWVACADEGVRRIDPDTNMVSDPTLVNHPAGLAITDEAVWVTSFDDDTVLRLDPDTLEVVGDPLTVGDEPDAVAVGDDVLWVANRGDGTVSRIDLATGERKSIKVGTEPVGIAIDGERVWVIDNAKGTLVLIDAPTGKVLPPVSVGSGPLGLAVVGETVWVTLSKANAVVPVTVG